MALTRLPQAEIDGVDQFKLGFGAEPVTRADTVISERNAVAYGVMKRLGQQRVGPAIEGLVRRRPTRRASSRTDRSAASGPTTSAPAPGIATAAARELLRS
jgi:hypothetical protein